MLPPNAHVQTDATRPTTSSLPVGLLVAHDHDQDAAVVSFDAEIDLGSAPMLRAALLSVLEQHTGSVVVDLSKVPFMDSAGVHVLAETLRRLEPQKRPLALVCHEGGQVHRLLALVGLLDAVAVYRSRESAMIAGDDALRDEPDRGASDAWDAPGGPRTVLAPAIH